jgi:hypothetical protein
MTSSTHRQRQLQLLGKIEISRNVGSAGAAHDQRWMPIVGAILYQARRFIVGRIRSDDSAGDRGGKPADRRILKRRRALFACAEDPLCASECLYWATVKRCSG